MGTTDKEIRELKERYLQGETTLAEEKRLADLLRTAGNETEFADIRKAFSLFDRGEPAFSDAQIEAFFAGTAGPPSHTAAQSPAPSSRRGSLHYRLLRFAAMSATAAAVAGAGFFWGNHSAVRRAQSLRPVPHKTKTVTRTEVRWKTDTIYIEKALPPRPRHAPASPQIAAAPAPADTGETDRTATAPESHTWVNAQTAFYEQQKQMDDFARQYEQMLLNHENTY